MFDSPRAVNEKKLFRLYQKTMEVQEFDATLGGAEHLPFSANSWKFATSRSIEIAAMTESILHPSKTKLIFQTLPVHMRRRVMSHNCKRLPRKLRDGHLEQLKKCGLPPKQKRPSRKYRRRPANLLDEYNRRQRRHIWLETHIWHAKRFHMTERWGYRLALAPCDKAFRACYRATSAHCLMQDISYLTPIVVTGPCELIKKVFSNISIPKCGLSVTAKAFVSGNREGTLHFYKPNQYPFGYVGEVSFIWEPSESKDRKMWLFVHPSQRNEVEKILTDLCCITSTNETGAPVKKRKPNESLQVIVTPGAFNRFRLTGPNSHAILTSTLKALDNIEKIKNDKWTADYYSNGTIKLYLEEKNEYWQVLSAAASPSQLPPRLVLGLVVRDPRLSRPNKRTKAKPGNCEPINTQQILTIPPYASTSPIWDTKIHSKIKEKMLSNTQFIEHITKTQLVPGEVFEEDPKLQSVPIVLIQRPGSQHSDYKKLGYGCGWDIIVPSGYGVLFWQTFVMFGARTGGLRETESLAFETGSCYLPPDSEAGKQEELRVEEEMRERYFKLPPSKRVNYVKLGIKSSFLCHWHILLKDWGQHEGDSFFVLRDRELLDKVQESLDKHSKLIQVEKSESCLVPVYLQMAKKGNLKRYAMICLPKPGDNVTQTPMEPLHIDSNEKARKQTKVQHKQHVATIRRRKNKLKSKGIKINTNKTKKTKKEPSEFVKKMRELWLPSNVDNIRNSCSREVMGYLSQGAFSFSEAKSCGVGYIAYNALTELLKSGINYVLLRNTSSRKYRLANIRVIGNK